MDKRRLILTFFSLLSLISGIFIYLVLRNDTYFHSFLSGSIRKLFYTEANDNVIAVFLKCYFVDFLWGISLAFALNSVAYSFTKKSIIINCFVTFLIGLLFEFAQLADIISGTFDFVDIIMYAFAAFIIAVININIFKE